MARYLRELAGILWRDLAAGVLRSASIDVPWRFRMTSLAGAVQAVDSVELLESLRMNGAHGLTAERGALNELLSPPRDRVVSHRTRDRVEPALRDTVGVPADNRFYLLAKRATDVVGSFLVLLVL